MFCCFFEPVVTTKRNWKCVWPIPIKFERERAWLVPISESYVTPASVLHQCMQMRLAKCAHSLSLSFSAHKREVPYSGEEEEKRRVKVTTRDTSRAYLRFGNHTVHFWKNPWNAKKYEHSTKHTTLLSRSFLGGDTIHYPGGGGLMKLDTSDKRCRNRFKSPIFYFLKAANQVVLSL